MAPRIMTAPVAAKIVPRAAVALAAALPLLSPCAACAQTAGVPAPRRSAGAPRPLPARAVVHQKNGDRFLRAGDLRGAAREFALAAAAAPDEPLFRLSAGVALAALGQVSHAADQFRQARSLADDDVIAALLLESALDELRQTAQAQVVHLETARRFDHKGQGRLDGSGSVARLRRAVTLFPESAVAHLLLGDAYQVSERWDDAVRSYDKAKALAPRWAKPHVNLGVLHLDRERPAEAIKAFETALALEPRNVQAQLLKGDAQAQMGRPAAALQTYNNVVVKVENAPKIAAEALTRSGNLHLKNQRVDQASRFFSRAKTLDPRDLAAVAGYAEAQVRAGNFKEGADAYISALRLANSGGLLSTRPILYRGLAEAHLSAGRPDAALETLRGALQEEPRSAPLWHRLMAQAYFVQGDVRGGESALRRALEGEIGRYPLETLRALDAQGLLPRVTAAYEEGLARSARSTGVRLIGPANPTTLVALAHLARYRNDTAEEIRLREQVARSRSLGVDWFLLAEAYGRAGRLEEMRNACERALQRRDLPPTAEEWVRSRLKAPVKGP